MKGELGFILPLGRQLLNQPFTYAEKRRLAAFRKADRDERHKMEGAGYRRHETDWEIHRGARTDEHIVDAKISFDGRYVWTKLGRDAPP